MAIWERKLRAGVNMCELGEKLKTREKYRKRDRNSKGKEESQKRSLKAGRAKDRGAGQRGQVVPDPEFYGSRGP